MEVEQTFKRGDQVAYLPPHAEENLEHPDVEYGFVTSAKGEMVFCRFWLNTGRPGTLRTVSNSESCKAEQLVKHEYMEQATVDALLETLPSRSSHLAWAKQRALAYLDVGDTHQAVASMVSDMRKHEGSDEVGEESLATHVGLKSMWVLFVAMSGNSREVRNWIEGFR